MSERDDDFLARWSRRKAESHQGLKKKEEEESAAEPAPPAPAGSEPPERTARATPGDAPLGEEDRADEEPRPGAEETGESGFEDVDFDKLDYNSDYTRFMGKDVPEAVRRRALRMLWQSNPILANIDGLNDYDEDFTDAAMVVKEFATNYKVGSGYLSEEERLASYHDDGEAAAAEDGETPAEDGTAEPEETGRTRTAAAPDDGDEGEADFPDGEDDETV